MNDIERAMAADELRPRITVVGVGGAGGNAVARLIASDTPGIDFILANTDAQALNNSTTGRRIQLGRITTEGLGAGSLAAIGKSAAEESIEEISRELEGAHMCFIAAGMGGGTGTGAAPVIAKVAHDKGILTIAVVTTPFAFEGNRRARAADAGIEELLQHVDTLIVIPNQNLFRVANPNTTFKEAFEMADDVLQQGVRGITNLMVMPGLVNLDFADVRSVMQGMGMAMMGSGEAGGENRALEAAEMAIANPLLDGAITGARGMIISITGGDDMRLIEIDEAASHIRDRIDPDADIIWGSAIDPKFDGRMRVSIVATGLDANAHFQRPAVKLPPPPVKAAAPAIPFARKPTTIAAVPIQPTAAVEEARTAEASVLELVEMLAIEAPPVAAPAPSEPVFADLFEPAAARAAAPAPLQTADWGASSFAAKLARPVVDASSSQAEEGRRRSRSPSLFERMTSALSAATGYEAPKKRVRSAVPDMPGVYNRRELRRAREDRAGESPPRLIGVRPSTGFASSATSSAR